MNHVAEIVSRTSAVYIFLIMGFRILGKQHITQISINDFVLILLISNAVQNAMVGDNTSLWGGIVSASALLLLSYIFSKILYHSPKIRNIFSGQQIVLIIDGKFIEENLKKIEMTHDEIEVVIREHGIDDVKDVHSAIIEIDGAISIIAKPEDKDTNPKVLKAYRKKSNPLYYGKKMSNKPKNNKNN